MSTMPAPLPDVLTDRDARPFAGRVIEAVALLLTAMPILALACWSMLVAL